MKTEYLNEYIFADLVYKHAQASWKRRVKKLDAEGIDDAYKTTPLGEEDLQFAIELLDWYRVEGLKLLAKSRTQQFSGL